MSLLTSASPSATRKKSIIITCGDPRLNGAIGALFRDSFHLRIPGGIHNLDMADQLLDTVCRLCHDFKSGEWMWVGHSGCLYCERELGYPEGASALAKYSDHLTNCRTHAALRHPQTARHQFGFLLTERLMTNGNPEEALLRPHELAGLIGQVAPLVAAANGMRV